MKCGITQLALQASMALMLPSAFAAEGRHALIVGIGQYSEASQTTALPGVPKDMENARKMAYAMGIEDQNIVELRDTTATKQSIIRALQDLRAKVQHGDKVFIYYSGHGTRYGVGDRCVEGLQTYSSGPFTEADVLSEEDLAKFTHPISERADKLVTIVDACFSGGVLAGKTRSLSQVLGIRPKYNTTRSECGVAVNERKTRSFEPAMSRLGASRENFVQIAAANYNEVSWDFPQFGGLATHSLAQCLLGEARDINGSGAVSLEEIRQCAQQKVDETMKPHARYGRFSSTLQIRGARNLVVTQTPPLNTVSTQQPLVLSEQTKKDLVAVSAPPTAAAGSSSVDLARIDRQADQKLSAEATLRDVYEQRNGRLRLDVSAPKQLVIGKDPFEFSVRANADGYLYAVMLGSDGKSFYLLFPNKIDQDNRIKANTRYNFPRPGWSVKAGGPDGTNQILFVLSQSPRDSSVFVPDDASGGGPFTYSVTDLDSRRRLIDFFIGRGVQGRNGSLAASLISVKEIP